MGFFKSEEIKKHYDIESKKLGEGNFAIVKKATKKSSADGTRSHIPTTVAIKIIDKAKVDDMKDIQNEISILEKMNHNYIVKLYEIFDEKSKMKLVMELVTGGELFDKIVDLGSYTEKDAAMATYNICDALNYMHTMKPAIVHRDLKPENIILASEDAKLHELKIADFGLSTMVADSVMMKTACGTPGYVAPEVLKNKGYSGGACDMWSVGVILYILLCGFPPFYEEELPALFDQIMKGKYDFPSPYWDTISKEAKDVVRAMLTINPAQRLTAEKAMKEAWVKGSCSTEQLDQNLKKHLRKFNATRKLKNATKKLQQLKLLKTGSTK